MFRWSWSFFLKKFHIVGVPKKVFEWLAASKFLSKNKNYLCFSCISICFSFSSWICLSTNKVFEHLSMKKDPFNQIIRKWPPKGDLVDLLEKYLGMNFFKVFSDVWKFFKVLSYQSFDVKCLLLSWDAYVYRQARKW